MTWRDDVADIVDGPVRAGWEILDAARAISFTGMIELPLLPVTRVYLDRGRIYLAERDDHSDVADRLVAVGAVRPDDLARGVITIDGADHLGRLFERVPSLDRQRVVLALEVLTEETAAWAAAQSVRDAVSHPYRHHPSGVHLWYQTAPDAWSPREAFPPPAPAARPARRGVADVAPPPPSPSEPAAPEPSDERSPSVDAPPSDEVGSELTEPVAPAPVIGDPSPSGTPPPEPLREEPSYEEEPGTASAQAIDHIGDHIGGHTGEHTGDRATESTDFSLVWPSGEVGPVEEFSPPSAGSDTVVQLRDDRFDTPDRFDAPDRVEGDDDPVAHEVTLAVRRAIAAVESGTARGRPVKPVVPVLDDDPDPFDRWAGVDRSRRATDVDDDDPWTRGPEPFPPPASGDQDDDEERRTTIQRLIDGLRGRPT